MKALSCVLVLSAIVLAPSAVSDHARNQLQLLETGYRTLYLELPAGSNNSPVPFMVDTGSGFNVLTPPLHEAYAQSTTPPIEIGTIEGVLSDGSTLVLPIYRLPDFQFSANCTISPFEYTVLNRATNILGLRTLQDIQAVIVLADEKAHVAYTCQ